MIVITGAAGFIGSCLVAQLNRMGREDLILADDFSRKDKLPNLAQKRYVHQVHRDHLLEWLSNNSNKVEGIFHLGARTDTTEKNWDIFDRLNLRYSKQLWQWCSTYNCPLIYASSAATYGGGEYGFSDDHNLIPSLQPLNSYGESKQAFDMWALNQVSSPPWWIGLKFFNVYGPNEYHKGRMASVIFHAYRQILQNGNLRLFRSHRPDYADGEQARDFIYVKDLIAVMLYLWDARPERGVYNLGTGQARTFNDLAKALFQSMDQPFLVEYIDTPIDIRDTYQYFTEARMAKLLSKGYVKGFVTLEEGITDYVNEFLAQQHRW